MRACPAQLPQINLFSRWWGVLERRSGRITTRDAACNGGRVGGRVIERELCPGVRDGGIHSCASQEVSERGRCSTLSGHQAGSPEGRKGKSNYHHKVYESSSELSSPLSSSLPRPRRTARRPPRSGLAASDERPVRRRLRSVSRRLRRMPNRERCYKWGKGGTRGGEWGATGHDKSQQTRDRDRDKGGERASVSDHRRARREERTFVSSVEGRRPGNSFVE